MVEVDGEMKHRTTLSGTGYSIYLEYYEDLEANGDGQSALLAPGEPASGLSDADYAALAQGVVATGAESSDKDEESEALDAVFSGDLWKFDQ
jgi:hypothetical protein